jgi:hypothetical protein
MLRYFFFDTDKDVNQGTLFVPGKPFQGPMLLKKLSIIYEFS